ncbi:dnaJ homolog subfamily C member 4 isoform X2 [Rhincodon typus]|uniref:dnaJ homolog subfamily C member 4 isoform X2 n=1 Tax=Rhincodon typus TaxID=259920 RepID=UPI0020301AB1|nr:dnaJ homolog subfamily C member 4 isoform X2 [Rhincodon typus]XP_048475525.1 dnaJ homolog subfamily C member 4 isoform X2 [Rhincodon typus]
MLLGAQTLAGKYCLRFSVCSRRISTALYRFSGEDYYTVLGIQPDATLKQIKQAFLDQSKKLHPDIDVSNPELHSRFVRLNEAYSVLSKPSSRREYDRRLRLQRHGPPGGAPGNPVGSGGNHGDPFFYNSVNAAPRYGYNMSEQQKYWEQFRYATPEDYKEFHNDKKRKRNMKVFGYCVFIMLAGVFIHYVGFRKLEEFHKNFMANKDRAITEIYNESKERARLNGFKKQQEILRQKHAAFMEKYRLKTRGGSDE